MSVGRIDSFWSQINDQGISKNSHWDVQINLPDSLRGSPFINSYPGIDRTLAFRCEAGELPGRQVVTADQKIYGPIYRTPYQSLYTELNLTFVETADLQIRQFMEAWMDTIFDSRTNIMRYQETYTTKMIITQYHVEGVPPALPITPPDVGDFAPQANRPGPIGAAPALYVYLEGAYPVNINQMATSWSDDSPHRVQVTFFYEWYTMAPVSGPTLGRSQRPESRQEAGAPVGLYDTATSWFSRTTKKFF